MNGPNPDPRKRDCEALARILAEPEGLRTVRLMQAAGMMANRQSQTTAKPVKEAKREGPQPISIWAPERDGNGKLRFTRPEPGAFGDHFAARRSIEATKKKGVRRICFFGESVAAGYLYAPLLTPAQVLETQLAEVAGPGRFEVVDLAKTNENLSSMIATLDRSRQLSPDLFVIFAGNNWPLMETPWISPYVPSVRSRCEIAETLEGQGLFGPMELSARTLLEKAGRALARIGEIAGECGIPVVWAIPEVNLADWENRQPVMWLDGDATNRWHELYRQAVGALAQGSWEKARNLANRMMDLDQGSCPGTYRILALAHKGMGHQNRASKAARADVDAVNIANLCFLGAPQASSAVMELQRRGGAYHGFHIVDLPAIFAAHTGSALPGKRLFLDYCHLTVEGIKLAMAGVAAEVLSVSGFGDQAGDWKKLMALLPDPSVDADTDALAKFGAAIHGAHRLLTVGPRAPILEYWCGQALEASPAAAETMAAFVEARSAPCPAVLTRAQQTVWHSPRRLSLQHGWQYDYLDIAVIEAVFSVLERRDPKMRDTLVSDLIQKLGIGRQPSELLPFYLWDPLARFYPEVLSYEDLNGRIPYRSPWPFSELCLIADARCDLQLSITARLPGLGLEVERSGQLEVRLGNAGLATLTVANSWRKAHVVIPRNRLKRGVNRLTLCWPALPPWGEKVRQAAIARLKLGWEADLHPVFGELFSMTAMAETG